MGERQTFVGHFEDLAGNCEHPNLVSELRSGIRGQRISAEMACRVLKSVRPATDHMSSEELAARMESGEGAEVIPFPRAESDHEPLDAA